MIEKLLKNVWLLPANGRAGYGYSQLIEHPAGNLLLPRLKEDSLSDCFDWIEERGGLSYVLISDRHFGGPGCVEVAERFDAALVISDVEAAAIARRCKVAKPVPFARTTLERGVTAVPTPGHTPGQFSFLIELDGSRLLFTADFVRFEHGAYVPGNKSRRKMRAGLESLTHYDFDRIIGCTNYDDGAGCILDVDDVEQAVAQMIEDCPKP